MSKGPNLASTAAVALAASVAVIMSGGGERYAKFGLWDLAVGLTLLSLLISELSASKRLNWRIVGFAAVLALSSLLVIGCAIDALLKACPADLFYRDLIALSWWLLLTVGLSWCWHRKLPRRWEDDSG